MHVSTETNPNPYAAAAKEAGNAAFAAGRFDEAIERFSDAIRLDPSSAVLRSNRAGAQASLGRHVEALADATMAVSLAPDWWKGYSRTGHAQFQLARYAESEQSFREALRLNPQEKTMVDQVDRACKKRQESGQAQLAPPCNSAVKSLHMAACNVAPAAWPPACSSTAKVTDGDFVRLSAQEMQQRVEQIAAELPEGTLDLELGRAGIAVPKGADRAEKLRLFSATPQSAVNTNSSRESPWTCLHRRCVLDSSSSRADKLLAQRKRWLAEWQTWDDARLLKRLRAFGVDGEGCRRDALINRLLQVETERFGRARCTPHVIHAAGLCFVAAMIIGTFTGFSIWFAMSS